MGAGLLPSSAGLGRFGQDDVEGGQLIGATNAKAEFPTERPVEPLDLCATVYHALQLDPSQLVVTLPDGRPIHLAKGGKVPTELL